MSDQQPLNRARVIVAATEPLFLAGIRSILVARPEIELVTDCRSFLDTVRALRKHKPRVLVADAALCHDADLDDCVQLPQVSPQTTIAWLARPGASVPPEVILGGSCIVLPARLAPRELVDCIRAITAGRTVPNAPGVSGVADRRSLTPRLAMLTRRERQIAQGVASGKRNREIAEAFAISPATVKLHLHRIYTKLGVSGRLALYRVLMDPAEPPFTR